MVKLQPTNAGACNILAWVSAKLNKENAIPFAEKANSLAVCEVNRPVAMEYAKLAIKLIAFCFEGCCHFPQGRRVDGVFEGLESSGSSHFQSANSLPEPPSSAGMSAYFGRPSAIERTFSP